MSNMGKDQMSKEMLVAIAGTIETLLGQLHDLAENIEIDETKSLGFKPNIYSNKPSNQYSKPKIRYGRGSNIEKTIDIQKNADSLVAGVLSGRFKSKEVAEALKSI